MDVRGDHHDLRLHRAIASSLTLSQLESNIERPGDLAGVGRVLTVADSTSARYLARAGIAATSVADPVGALGSLARGAANAVVYDAPILRYHVEQGFHDRVHVLPWTFERQDYAIGLQLDSPLRKALNQALLAELGEAGWQDVLRRYLGSR